KSESEIESGDVGARADRPVVDGERGEVGTGANPDAPVGRRRSARAHAVEVLQMAADDVGQDRLGRSRRPTRQGRKQGRENDSGLWEDRVEVHNESIRDLVRLVTRPAKAAPPGSGA